MTDTIEKTIGTRAAALRVARAWTRQQVAERTDMTAKLVGRIERGTSPISASRLVALAKGLGVPSTVLTGEQQFDGWLDASGGAA